ncbi:M81 family metallopeptidase [Enterovirga rhinocerotis]|uniref:Microcystinase C n=1 Tax=Enterovirga rhinocerotis TaxID=1339210 RepID=A0A4V3DWE7_9HYPH|nr:M81 family metallopeptidase [Enterovirga rhinocerotis]TDR84569.1 microcystin degradation protein MlrC [Enterovirga rhinocerotis]
MARIAIGGFQHETNSFVEPKTDFAYFASHRDRPPLVRGGDVVSWLTGTSFAMAGFMAAMPEHELVPLLWTSGGAGGTVTADAFERIAAELVGRLSEAMPVDAVYLDLHGAMVSERFEDGEGELLRRLRDAVGPDMPIVISLDYHANVTPEMAELTDGILAYLTYPHVDRVETGERAARVMEAVLARGRPRGRAIRKAPFLIPLNGQCTLVEPSKGVVGETATCAGDVLSLSYLAGFPPSDLHGCGPTAVAHAWTQEAADRAAEAMMARIEAEESRFAERMISPEEAVAEAMRLAAGASRPVVIADTQDNPGCGGTADTTGVLRALLDAKVESAALGFLCDAEAAAAAHGAGEGAEVTLALGGRSGPEGVSPLDGTFRVLRLGDGRFRTSGAVSGGRAIDLGPMALLGIGGIKVAVTSKRMQALDQEPFRHLGIEPKDEAILALKSTCHFRAEFEPLAEAVIVALAPGYYRADPTTYPFRRLRRGVRLKPMGTPFDG